MPPAASSDPIPQRFVLVAEARSGSGWLASLLRSHPACVCYDELFHPTELNGGMRRYDLEGRREDERPTQFLERIFAQALQRPGVTRVGYKHIVGVDTPALREILNQNAFRVLLLTRRDRLAQYASLRAAQATGTWAHMPHFEPPPVPRIAFDARDFIDFCRAHDRALAEVRRLLAETRQPCHALTYEELAADRGMDRVLAYLGLPPHPLTSRHMRQDAREPAERFDDPRRARRLGRLIAWRPTRKLVRILRGVRPLRPLVD